MTHFTGSTVFDEVQRDGEGNERRRRVFRRIRVRFDRENSQRQQRVQIQVHHERRLRNTEPQDWQVERYYRRLAIHGEHVYSTLAEPDLGYGSSGVESRNILV